MLSVNFYDIFSVERKSRSQTEWQWLAASVSFIVGKIASGSVLRIFVMVHAFTSTDKIVSGRTAKK